MKLGWWWFFRVFPANSWVISKWLNSWDDRSWRIIPGLVSGSDHPHLQAIYWKGHVERVPQPYLGDLGSPWFIRHLKKSWVDPPSFPYPKLVRAKGWVLRTKLEDIFWGIQLFGPFFSCKKTCNTKWLFPKIVGFPPKSSILIGFSIINHPFWGTTIFGNTQILTKSSKTWKNTIYKWDLIWMIPVLAVVFVIVVSECAWPDVVAKDVCRG